MVLEMLTAQDRAVADILIEGEVALLDTNKGAELAREPLNRNAPTWIDKDLVRSLLNHAFKRYGAKEASAADITRVLMDLGVVDTVRNAHRERDQRAGYRFVPLQEAREKFAAKRKIDVKFLQGANTPRSPYEEIQDIANAAVKWCGTFDTQPGAPANFREIENAILELQRRVQASEPANDNSAAA